MKKTNFFLTRMLVFALAIGVVAGVSSCKEEGCTDPEANNYNEDADEDDGSCTYDPVDPAENIDFGTLSGSNGLADLDGYNEGSSTLTMGGNDVYSFEGILYVNDGQTLEIEPGAVIKVGGEVNGLASAIVVARGGKIMAEGTADNPIIFTSDLDDLSDANDFGPSSAGLWGSLIILGDGPIGVDGANEAYIEGLPESDDRNLFGGSNETHNGGVLKYVSIRYTGAALGPGNEIQGLTLGGVGSATEISHVEIYSSDDDGIEIFGGDVNMDHIAIAWATDDALDLDNGWRGTVEDLFLVQLGNSGDHLGEWDGAQPDGNARYTRATVNRATMMGAGDGSLAILTRDGGVVSINNSIIFDSFGRAIEVEDKDEPGVDSYSKLDEATYNNNVWYLAATPNLTTWAADSVNASTTNIQVTEGAADGDGSDLIAKFNAGGNTIANPNMTWSDQQDGRLDPFSPSSGTGAFGGGNWLEGWSGLSTLGHLAE